ncbi:translation initiation factor IF-2-like [Nycticebus coucang]|uniref:translation initiation factor IF-2-like n=1 Tax=Nycticebus coucang TaxID=9470 RepID=UPI00234E2A4C|nr:translation initiation factor IF-2-like [Nycticebus coucang]
MPPRAQRRAAAAAAAPLPASRPPAPAPAPRACLPPGRAAWSSPLGLAPGVPRGGRADWPLGLHSRPPYCPRTHSRPRGAAATWGVERGWHWDRTPSRPGCVGPASPSAGDSEPGRSRIPRELNSRLHPARAARGGGEDCGLREALRLREAAQPGAPFSAEPLRAGRDSRGSRRLRAGGGAPSRLSSGAAASLASLASRSFQRVQSAPLRGGPARLGFRSSPCLVQASQLRQPLWPRERVRPGQSRADWGFTPRASAPSPGRPGRGPLAFLLWVPQEMAEAYTPVAPGNQN